MEHTPDSGQSSMNIADQPKSSEGTTVSEGNTAALFSDPPAPETPKPTVEDDSPPSPKPEPATSGATPVAKENDDTPKPAATPVAEPVDVAAKDSSYASDPDAQAMVISSLRGQIQDLFSQVTQLNTKLVQSYDRVSDLEDDLHMTSSTLRSSSLKVSQLELERTQHLSALNTGLLVERTQVVSELTRLMEKATEEAAQRGQAESARRDIEKDLDDLSASLFGQANSMVAEARYAQALSERKVDDAELALKGAEEVVGIIQRQMQDLQSSKEEAEKSAEEMRSVMGKGKWVDRHAPHDSSVPTHPLRLMSSHLPYQDFLMFVTHLRSVHPTQLNPPTISTLLSLPFLARLMLEDSDPTVRIDLAPSLNWLSRRSVVAAIHSGQLTIEPMSSMLLLQETAASSPLISGINSSSNNVSCALCGTPVFPTAPHTRKHSHATTHSHSTSTWSPASLFKMPITLSSSPMGSPPTTPVDQGPSMPLPSSQAQIYIFRLVPTTTATAAPVSQPPAKSSAYVSPYNAAYQGPSTSQAHNTQPRAVSVAPAPSTVYPLCTSGWCLTRLRTTCSLWAFVRTGIVDKIWDEELVHSKPPAPRRGSMSSLSRVSSYESTASTKAVPATVGPASALKPPPVPPRRKSLWGLASAFGERAASWTEDKKPLVVEEPTTPTPSVPVFDAAASTSPPPPLPKRNEGRARTMTGPSRGVSPVPVASEEEETKVASVSPVLPPRRQVSAEDMFSTPAEELATNPLDVEKAAEVEKSAVEEVQPVDSQEPVKVAEANPGEPEKLEETAVVLLVEEKPVVAEGAEAKAVPEVEVEKPVGEVEKLAAAATPVVPSRTSSPAPPPPLPRRAAARAPRPVSVVAAPVSSVVADAPTAPLTEESSTSIVVEEKPAVVAEEKPTVVEEKPAEEQKEVAQVEENPVEEKVEVKEDAAASGAEKDAEAAVPQETKQSTPTALEAEPSVELKPAADIEKETPALPNGVVSAPKPALRLDPSVHITDASWEERTWKELVRLREEMFWARVGGTKTAL